MNKKTLKLTSLLLSVIVVFSLFASVPVSAETTKTPLQLSIEHIHSDAKGQIFLYSKNFPNLTAKNNQNRSKITDIHKTHKIQVAYSTDKTFKNSVKYFTDNITLRAYNSRARVEVYLNGLTPNKTYYCKMRTYITKNGKKVYSDWSNVKSIKVANKTNSEAEIIKDSKGNKKLLYCRYCGKVYGTGYNNTCYYFARFSFEELPTGVKDGCNHFGKRLSKISKVTGLKKKNTYGGLVLSWNKIDGVTGYQVQYADNSSFKNAKTKTTTRCTDYNLTGLAKNKKYYVRVRAYTGPLDKVGAWSSKIYGYATTMMPNGVKIKTRVINLEYKTTVSCRDFYGPNQRVKIVYSTDKNFKNAKSCYMDWGMASKTLTNLKKGKTYYFKLISYHYDNNKKVDSTSAYTGVYKRTIK